MISKTYYIGVKKYALYYIIYLSSGHANAVCDAPGDPE